MQSSPEADELAAVVADGRPFDWSTIDDTREHRPLLALWRAVRRSERDRTAPPVTRATHPAGFAWLTILVILKAVGTSGLLALAPGAVDVTQVITLVSFTVVGAGLAYGGNRDLRARRLGVVLLLVGSVMTKPLLRQVSEAWTEAPAQLALSQRIAFESMLPAAMWLFVAVFPASVWSPRDAVLLRRGLVSSTVTGLVLLGGNALIALGLTFPGLWIVDRDTGGSSAFWAIVFPQIAAALAFMLCRRRDAEPAERSKVNAFAASLVLALAPATLIIMGYWMVPTLRDWFEVHFAATGAAMYSGLIALPVVTSYAVLAHRVVRVDLVLRSASRYALAKGLLLTATLGPLALLSAYFYRNQHQTVGELFSSGLGRTLLGLSIGGAMLLAARDRIQRVIDRAWRRDTVSLASALDVFARRSGEGVGLGDVVDAMQRSVVAAFHPRVVAVLIADRTRDAFVPVGAALAPLARATLLAEALTGVRDPVVVDLEDAQGVARLLPRADQDWLADAGVVVLAPLMASGGTLCGLMALGPMTSGRDYTDGDLRYIGALAAAASPAIESRLLRPSGSVSSPLDDVRWDDESGRECPSCGQTFAADVNACRSCDSVTTPMPLPVHLHGKFTLTRRLGAGGMGVVFLAHDDALGRPVALKALPRVRPEAVEQLRREARAMAQVSHPALASIHGLESWRAVPVLVVEYLNGGTLADRLRAGPLPESEVIALARHVVGGLGRLHAAGLLHRDLKPSNIGFAADGTAKVLDFGLSRLRIGAVDDAGLYDSAARGVSGELGTEPDATSLAGTPAYMSPEVVAGRPPAPTDDLWALAVVMVEALRGTHPWAALSVREVLRRLRSAESPGASHEPLRCSKELSRLLHRALSPMHVERPQTAAEFEREVADLRH